MGSIITRCGLLGNVFKIVLKDERCDRCLGINIVLEGATGRDGASHMSFMFLADVLDQNIVCVCEDT
jgi:hypothetical protein